MHISTELWRAADEYGITLQIVGGLPVWKGPRGLTHQRAVDRIRRSIRPSNLEGGTGQCIHVYDLDLCFKDGSQMRPDISIFSREPDEKDSEVTLLPEAVIEILSKGYEAKDLQIGVPFYLSQGVNDVVVFDPYSLKVLHFHGADQKEFLSPVNITFQCGCQCTV